jgi:hypothetical protein
MRSDRSLGSLALLSIFLLVGCATPVGGKTKFPEASQGFSPKKIYAGSHEALWNAAQSALEKNRIVVLSQDKASGFIQTDYIEGVAYLIGGGFIAAQSTRYKYNITVRPQSEREVRLAIVSRIESTMKGGSGASQWTDVSSQNTKLTASLEDWLFEEIEKELQMK